MTRELLNSRISIPNSWTFGVQWKNKYIYTHRKHTNSGWMFFSAGLGSRPLCRDIWWRVREIFQHTAVITSLPLRWPWVVALNCPSFGRHWCWIRNELGAFVYAKTPGVLWGMGYFKASVLQIGCWTIQFIFVPVQQKWAQIFDWNINMCLSFGVRSTDLLASSCKIHIDHIGTSSLSVHLAMLKIHFGFHFSTLNCPLDLRMICADLFRIFGHRSKDVSQSSTPSSDAWIDGVAGWGVKNQLKG